MLEENIRMRTVVSKLQTVRADFGFFFLPSMHFMFPSSHNK